MDSHLIAGAYSQQYQTLKDDETLINSDRLDSIARAKRLSQETNRRRKLQAHKRKLQAKREEKRRHDILARRREEQRQATERYQRSHLPPSARQSYRFVSRRPNGAALDDALQLIRGAPHYNHLMSSRERTLSDTNEIGDVLEASFNKPRPYSARPGSGKLTHQLNSRERIELMNHSKQNMTASKTLFEQLLKQQQSLLLEKQQHSLQEFSHAVHREIDGEKTLGRTDSDLSTDGDAQDSEENITHSNSCSSLDSLEESIASNPEYTRPINPRNTVTQSRQRPVSAYHISGYGQSKNQTKGLISQQQQQQQRLENMKMSSEIKYPSYPQNQTISALAMHQKNGSLLDISQAETKLISDAPSFRPTNTRQQQNVSYNGLTNDSVMPRKKDTTLNGSDRGTMEQNCHMPIKQCSTDSLESCSSVSSLPVLKDKGEAKESTRGDTNLQSEDIKNGGITFGLNAKHANGAMGNNAGIYKQQYLDNISSGQKFAVSSTNNVSNISTQKGQMSWISPSTKTGFTNFPGNENKLNSDNFQPRYASVIGASILPESNVQNQIPTSTQPSMATTTSIILSVPANSTPNAVIYSMAGSRIDSVAKMDALGNKMMTVSSTKTATDNTINSNFHCLDKHDSTFPQVYDYPDLGNVATSSNKQQGQTYSTKEESNCQIETKLLSSHIISDVIGGQGFSTPSNHTNMPVTTIQNIPSNVSNALNYPLYHGQDAGSCSMLYTSQYKQQLNDEVPDNTTNVPAVRRNFPSSRPPSPVVFTAAKVENLNLSAIQMGQQLVNTVGKNEVTKITSDQASAMRGQKFLTSDNSKEYVEDAVLVDEDSEEMRPLRGILKQASVKTIPQYQEKVTTGKAFLRDSLELAHVHNDKKIKKKSVRFASHLDEEDDDGSDETEHIEKWSVTVAGAIDGNEKLNRPLSAKVSSTSKLETGEIGMKAQRALSAGPLRHQQPIVSEHIQIRNVQQISSTSAPVESTDAAYSSMHGQRSNLPPSFVGSLNTTPIHRPKAAAHIIMSSDIHKETSKGYDNLYTGPTTIQKSQLETKIKSINNNFMSKVPVKIPTNRDTNAVVYNVSYTPAEGNLNSNANISGIYTPAEDIIHQVSREPHPQQNADKSRNTYPESKVVTFSNSGVTRSNVASASTKVVYAQSNRDDVSSTGAGHAVYDETGMRIDRTPTDDEITWLWDKVRNCLNRENGNKSHSFGNGNNDQGPRQPPILSTKLIDGAALEFGTYQNGLNNARPGSFYPRAAPVSNIQNNVKPVLQQQGSYLRRYGLLKSRRASSASAIRSNTGPEGQSTGNVIYGRNSSTQPHLPSSTTGQLQQRDIPTPMAYGYKPQDEVSESTAAFLMAERLAKQSLSDSHIQMAMEDAHHKQEAFNRSKMTEARNGHSALSIEEHRLIESLDRLNEKLKATDPNFKGNINYHQPVQAQRFM